MGSAVSLLRSCSSRSSTWPSSRRTDPSYDKKLNSLRGTDKPNAMYTEPYTDSTVGKNSRGQITFSLKPLCAPVILCCVCVFGNDSAVVAATTTMLSLECHGSDTKVALRHAPCVSFVCTTAGSFQKLCSCVAVLSQIAVDHGLNLPGRGIVGGGCKMPEHVRTVRKHNVQCILHTLQRCADLGNVGRNFVPGSTHHAEITVARSELVRAWTKSMPWFLVPKSIFRLPSSI